MTLKEALKTLSVNESPMDSGPGLMGYLFTDYDYVRHAAAFVLMQPSSFYANVPVFIRCEMPVCADHRFLRWELRDRVWQRADEDTTWLARPCLSKNWLVLDICGIAAAVRRLP